MGTEYQQSVLDVVSALDTDASRGLTASEARARRVQYGPNELRAERPVPAWKKFLAQFTDLLVILLLIATAISAGLWLYERDTPLPYEAIAISAVVLLNAIMGYLQEQRAEPAIAALRQMAAPHARVVRDGGLTNVAAADVVAPQTRLLRGNNQRAFRRVAEHRPLTVASPTVRRHSRSGWIHPTRW